MKTIFENRLRMMIATEKELNDSMPVWQNTPKFNTAVTNFSGKLTSIVGERQVEEKQIKNLTADKQLKKKSMCECAAVVSDVVYAYADDAGDMPLKGLIHYSLSMLIKSVDTDARDRCLLIYNTAAPLEQAGLLNDYGLEPIMQPALNTAIEEYQKVLTMPRNAIGWRKTSKINIKKFLDEAEAILSNQIDKMMTRFKKSKPDFYNHYQSARMIIDLGHRSKKPISTIKGITTDFVTEQILGGVHIWLEDGSSEVYSDATGKYELPVYKAGTVCILAEKPDYKRSEEDWDVANGTDYEINIDLEQKELVVLPEEPPI